MKYSIIVGLAGIGTAKAQEPDNSPPRHNFSAGGYYSYGDYGQTEDTTIRYLPASYDYTVSNWNLKVAVPYLEVSGLGNVLVNVGGIGTSEFNGLVVREETKTSRGRGDTVLSATYQFPTFAEGVPFIDLGFEVKLPTSSRD